MLQAYPFVGFLAHLILGTFLGLLIGYEREYRGSPAGLHTTGLVAAGAALFAGIGPLTNVNMLPNIVTGVGFLAGGVIFRRDSGVSGLNTAATIWSTAAVGALAGIGLYPEALAGTVTILLVNIFVDPISKSVRERIARRQQGASRG